MVLVDTSVWIDFLKGASNKAVERLKNFLLVNVGWVKRSETHHNSRQRGRLHYQSVRT